MHNMIEEIEKTILEININVFLDNHLTYPRITMLYEPTECPAPRSAPLLDSISNCFFKLAMARLHNKNNCFPFHHDVWNEDLQPVQWVLGLVYVDQCNFLNRSVLS